MIHHSQIPDRNILLLCNLPELGADANAIVDHILAFTEHSKHKIWLYSNIGNISPKLDLNKFDVIIIHYSMCLLNNYYISKQSKDRLRAFNGLKIVFVQDEYREINNMISQLQYLKIDVLFSCFPKMEIEKIYSARELPDTSKYQTMTGYVPSKLLNSQYQKPIVERDIHVGYRARKLPFWYGELAYEKWDIVNQWKKYVSRSDIAVDISFHERDRLYGEKWLHFLSSCKTMLGVESGASVMDFTGELEKQVNLHQATHPKDSFFEVQARYLLLHEGRYKLNQISPRCFEAIALKTVLVLYEGEYSGILVPDRHYIVLKKDFSNISEVIKKISDNAFLQNMADIAYQEIALNPNFSYQAFINDVDKIIDIECEKRIKATVYEPYTQVAFQKAIKSKDISTLIKKELMKAFKKLPPFLQLTLRVLRRPNVFVKNVALRIKGSFSRVI
ncbi:MAG: hypothetical protein HYX61_08125 [Gammaproteobacteria bacterium]|jgi:hypothetical protein|nr:hypothetical protein [Gammaproteobacteria bacterium]